MRNEWRVDRADGAYAPCGMNSIRSLEESERKARRVFDSLVPGFDAWDQPDSKYGVVLSRWNPSKCEYVAVAVKTCDGKPFPQPLRRTR